jgi:hypothetical protein
MKGAAMAMPFEDVDPEVHDEEWEAWMEFLARGDDDPRVRPAVDPIKVQLDIRQAHNVGGRRYQ